MAASPVATRVLIVRTGLRTFGIPGRHVVEVMRPLPVEPVPGGPEYFLGVSVIRGITTPVLDLGRLVGEPVAPGRFVTIRSGSRVAALAVERVLDFVPVDPERFEAAETLLGEISSAVVQDIGTLGPELLLTLDATRLITDEVWALVPPGTGTGT